MNKYSRSKYNFPCFFRIAIVIIIVLKYGEQNARVHCANKRGEFC